MDLLLDTNVVLYFLGGDERIIKLFSRAKSLAVTFISVIELPAYIIHEYEAKSIKNFLGKLILCQ